MSDGSDPLATWEHYFMRLGTDTNPRTVRFSPSAATHRGQIDVLWLDTTTPFGGELYWGAMTCDGTRCIVEPVLFAKDVTVDPRFGPVLVESSGMLHAIVTTGGKQPVLLHFQFIDTENRWSLPKVLKTKIDPAYAPTTIAFNDQIMCLLCNKAGEVSWLLWNVGDGWSREYPLAQAEKITVIARPALILLKQTVCLIMPAKIGLLQLKYDAQVNDWSDKSNVPGDEPIGPPPKDTLTSVGCDGIGYPTYLYGFLAYGTDPGDSSGTSIVSVAQYNTTTWMGRESLKKRCSDVPILVIGADHFVYCFYTTPEGQLAVSRRLIDRQTDDWMSRLDPKTLISSINIPGTHDSAAVYAGNLPFVETQKMSISQQLNCGIRFLDLRVAMSAEGLQMVHGAQNLGITFLTVRKELARFLEANPKETIIVTVKNDQGGNADLFDIAVRAAIEDEDGLKWFKLGIRPIPNLQDCYGKVVMFRRFPAKTTDYGFDLTSFPNWPATDAKTGNGIQCVIQDRWSFAGELSAAAVVAKKFPEVVNLIKRANDSPENDYFFNFASASGPPNVLCTPLNIATGGWFKPEDEPKYKNVMGMNQKILDHLVVTRKKKETVGRLGILIFDFPEVPAIDLIGSIIASNWESEPTTSLPDGGVRQRKPNPT